MVTKLAKAAAGVITGAFSSKNRKVDERRLLPILQLKQKLFVVEAPGREDDFILPPKRHAVAALTALFHGTKKAPGPLRLFNRSTNIVDLSPQYHRKRVTTLIIGTTEFDMVTFHLCTDLGQPKQPEQIVEMEKHGFVLSPLNSHPHAKDIKRVLKID